MVSFAMRKLWVSKSLPEMIKIRQKYFLLVIAFLGMAVLLTSYSVWSHKSAVLIKRAPKDAGSDPPYPYYLIFDERTSEILLTVSSVIVQAGDELITSDNRRYKVVRVDANKAYARFLRIQVLKPTPAGPRVQAPANDATGNMQQPRAF